jgi:hypothetical protein
MPKNTGLIRSWSPTKSVMALRIFRFDAAILPRSVGHAGFIDHEISILTKEEPDPARTAQIVHPQVDPIGKKTSSWRF